MAKITIELLDKHNACAEQRRLFEWLFPDGADVTRDNAETAINWGMSVFWLIETFCAFMTVWSRHAQI